MLGIPLVGVVSILALAVALHKPTTKPVCVIDECPLEIRGDDTGSTYTYRVGSRFTLMLDDARHSLKRLEVVCDPPGAIGSISNVPEAEPPLYAVRFESVRAGECSVVSDDFRVTVRVKESD